MRHPTSLVCLKRRPAGLSLLEVMVAMFVSSILLIVLVRLFTVSVRTGTEELSRSSTEAALLFALRALENDLQNSSPAGISLVTDGSQLVVHPMDDVLSTGQVVYDNRLFLWYFDRPDQMLQRMELRDWFPEPFDLRPRRFVESEVPGLISPEKLSRKVTGVTDFRVENPEDVDLPSIGTPITISLTAEIKEASARREVTLVRAVQVRSSGN